MRKYRVRVSTVTVTYGTVVVDANSTGEARSIVEDCGYDDTYDDITWDSCDDSDELEVRHVELVKES